MKTVKQLYQWHQLKAMIEKEKAALATLREQEQALQANIVTIKEKLSAFPATLTQDQEIQKLLLEQDLWMATKELERFMETGQAEMFALESSLSGKEFQVMAEEQQLDKTVLDKYLQLIEYVTSPIVEVKQKSCMGCFRALSMSNYNAWRQGKGLVCCDECGRILV